MGAMHRINAICLLAAMTTVHAQTAEVFKLTNQPAFSGSGIAVVHVVNQLDRHLGILSAGLPNTEAAATAIAANRLQALSQQDQNLLRASAIAHVRAAEYGIVKAPAIVFDGRATVYGLYDVDRARHIYQTWLQRQGR